ncbi:MAG TPA: M23 family metallopeptidase [Steroidobacteraceae bacterium]|nr:M23 family metallopeptidase [Steroidobacteraceae bacterium]
MNSTLLRAVAGIVAAIAVSGVAVGAQTAPAPSGEKLRQEIIAALGGEARLQGLKSYRATGSMVGLSGFPGSAQILARAPGDRLLTWDIRYLRQSAGVEGAHAWLKAGAVRELAGREADRARRDARFEPLYRLLEARVPFAVRAGSCAGSPVYLLEFRPPGGEADTFGVSRTDFLPRCEKRIETYIEGATEVENDFRDYRAIDGIELPFWIAERRPDNSIEITVDRYEINPAFAGDPFASPEQAFAATPIEMSLGTMPAHIYKEPDGNYTDDAHRFWGMYFYASESWSLDLLVRERHGRYLEPLSAHVDFYSGAQKMGSEDWSAAALRALRRVPVARFSPEGEIYGFRHNFTVPRLWKVDRMVYTLQVRAGNGRLVASSTAIPVTVYQPHAKLIFPIKGRFIVTSGHEFYELEHKYERSQQFAIDIIPLGPSFEFTKHNGATLQDYYGWAKRQVLAPAAGRVVYARNDVPDGEVKSDFLKRKDGLQAIAGNVVIIDHGNGEFSVFCHMHHGSVRVKTGDVVRQGQIIGLVGASGSPGLPHLHYQMQNGPGIFGADGLPLLFHNIRRVGWVGKNSASDDHGSAPVASPKSGVYMEAY